MDGGEQGERRARRAGAGQRPHEARRPDGAATESTRIESLGASRARAGTPLKGILGGGGGIRPELYRVHEVDGVQGGRRASKAQAAATSHEAWRFKGAATESTRIESLGASRARAGTPLKGILGGGGGIRTPGRVTPTAVFKSKTPPSRRRRRHLSNTSKQLRKAGGFAGLRDA